MIRPMLSTIIPISIGAVGGALLRHFFATNSVLNFTLFGFAWGVLLCNIFGSFAMGIFAEAGGKILESPTVRLMVATGFLGSFTTFSAFSLHTIDLIRNGHVISGITHVVVSVAISLIALYAGVHIVKAL